MMKNIYTTVFPNFLSLKPLSFEKNLAAMALAFIEGTSEDKIIDIDTNNNYTTELHKSLNKLHIFPNPNNGQTLYLQLADNTNIEYIEICDLRGKIHFQQSITNTNNLFLENFDTGLYLVRVLTSKGELFTQKLSVIR